MSFGPALLASSIDGILQGLPRPASGLCVAYSGGLDSTVLLHALRRMPAGLRLRAVHVDHGLSGGSADWAAHCERTCAALGIDCRVMPVDARAARSESPEAAARRARYQAIAAQLGANEILLTAHHADDQLETVLLQLLRGGGLAGAAGMPRLATFASGWQARPLLGYSREALRDWAQRQGLAWLEDPTNLDTRFDRNYLRLAVLPAIRDRWPHASGTIGQAALLIAEAVELIGTVAQADLAAVREGLTLPLASLDRLSEPRVRAVLRAWITSSGLPLPSARTLAALRRDLWQAADDRVPCARWLDARVYRYRGRLYAARARAPESGARAIAPGQCLDLGADGRLTFEAATGRGVSRARLAAGFELRPRRGGETFQPVGGAHRRPLRKWLQEHGVLPWLRDRIPLLYAGEELACVGDIGMAARLAAGPDEPSWEIRWTGRPTLTEAEALNARAALGSSNAAGRRRFY